MKNNISNKNKFRGNLDLVIAALFVIASYALYFLAKVGCEGGGCLFALVLVVFLLFDAVLFSVVLFAKGKNEKNIFKISMGGIFLVMSILLFVLVFHSGR